MDSLFTLTGRRLDPNEPTPVILHAGVGIQVDGQHLHGGKRGTLHTVPRHLALELIGSGRAHYPPAEADAPAATQPQSRDPEPLSNDPTPRRRR